MFQHCVDKSLDNDTILMQMYENVNKISKLQIGHKQEMGFNRVIILSENETFDLNIRSTTEAIQNRIDVKKFI